VKMVALLRGVNVGGNRKVPMPALCAAATRAGLERVASYINSGNLVFEAGKRAGSAVERLLEDAIEEQFGFRVEVIVRTAAQWNSYSRPGFPDAANERPALLQFGLSKLPCKSELAAALGARAMHGERIRVIGDAIWVDFPAGVGKSKLTPAVFDKAAGSTVTLRNWNTVLKLHQMLQE